MIHNNRWLYQYQLLPFIQIHNRKAVDNCIAEDIPEQFIRKNQAEVISVSIFEYDEKLHMRLERQDAKEEGRRKGRMEGRINLIRTMASNGYSAENISALFKGDQKLVHDILSLSEAHPDATDEIIYELWAAANATQ
jgi:hypothetical protein